MSFPKAPIKRFNEHVGCAPAPGSYDIKDCDGIKGATSFPKSQRFQKMKDGANTTQSLENESYLGSPARIRKQVSLGSTPNLSRRSEKDSDFVKELKKQKELDKEVRSLVKERGEQDKRLRDLEEEFKKTEAKLTVAVREKSSLSANVISLERQLAELNRANELMKTKFSDDSAKKKMNGLCAELVDAKNKLDAKDKDLSCQQIKFEGQIKVLHADLQASKTTVTALKEKNKYLEDARHEAKQQSEDLEKEMDKLHALILELRGENKTLHGYLTDSQEQIQDIRLQMSAKEGELQTELKRAHSNTEEQVRVLSVKHEEMELKVEAAERDLKEALEREFGLEEKLVATNEEREKFFEEKAETEKKLLEHLAEISLVSAQAEQFKLELAKTEDRLQQKDQASATQAELFLAKEADFSKQIKELGERIHLLQQEKECFITETQQKERILHAEVESLKKRLCQEEQASQMLQQKEDKLSFSLRKAEELTDALRKELIQIEEELRTEKSLLEEELEGTLDELDRLQLEEEHAEKLIAHLEQENRQRSEELCRLELTLKEKNAELERSKITNSKTIARLEEQQTTLCRLEEVTAELESYKLSTNGELESLKSKNSLLLEEMANLHTSKLDKEQQLQEIQCATAKEKEEFARMLLDAETNLALKEAEMKKSEETHFVEVSELHQQLELNEATLQQQCEEVASLRKESVDEKLVAELKQELQKWRTLFEDLHHKVKPFQQQLDMYEAEKNVLLNEHGAAQDELNKLSDAYTKLLGHQNQKQKIKHVMKLKEENFQLKQEVTRLRGQLAKEKHAVPSAKRLDPSKTFQGDSKENALFKAPLKEGNRKVMV